VLRSSAEYVPSHHDGGGGQQRQLRHRVAERSGAQRTREVFKRLALDHGKRAMQRDGVVTRRQRAPLDAHAVCREAIAVLFPGVDVDRLDRR
jgi:hypothetical protein